MVTMKYIERDGRGRRGGRKFIASYCHLATAGASDGCTHFHL